VKYYTNIQMNGSSVLTVTNRPLSPYPQGFMDFSFPRRFIPRTQWTFRSLDVSFLGRFVPWAGDLVIGGAAGQAYAEACPHVNQGTLSIPYF